MSDNVAETPEEMAEPNTAEAAMDADQSAAIDPDVDSSGDPPEQAQVSPEALEEKEAEEELAGDLDHMQAELTALNDRHLRLAAEFTNYRRRAETELSEAWARGQADLLRTFLDGLDDLQRVGAWQPESTTVEALVEGVDLVERKFRQALEFAGVEVLEPIGETFDPNMMEAMITVPTESPDEDHKVQDVFQKGYRFKGHLVRPARVTVFKHE